jgi:hypothetical protein
MHGHGRLSLSLSPSTSRSDVQYQFVRAQQLFNSVRQLAMAVWALLDIRESSNIEVG